MGQAVITQLREYKGRSFLDIRIYYTDKAGILQPTKKGISVAVLRLPELSQALVNALAKARELGLVDERP